MSHILEQWSSNLARGIHFPAEFNSKPDQTYELDLASQIGVSLF